MITTYFALSVIFACLAAASAISRNWSEMRCMMGLHVLAAALYLERLWNWSQQ